MTNSIELLSFYKFNEYGKYVCNFALIFYFVIYCLYQKEGNIIIMHMVVIG